MKIALLTLVLDLLVWRLIIKGIRTGFRWTKSASNRISDVVDDWIQGKGKKKEQVIVIRTIDQPIETEGHVE